MDESLVRLADLEYGRFRDGFIKEMNNKESSLSETFGMGGGIHSGAFLIAIIELHIDKIKTLYRTRIAIEKDLMVKKYGHLENTGMDELKRTVTGIIGQQMRVLADHHFLKSEGWAVQKIKESEIMLRNEAERDIEIEKEEDKLRIETERRERYSVEHVESLMEIFKLRDKVNVLFKQRFGFEIFKLHQEGVFPEIASPCRDENGFVRKILVLGNLIDWMDVESLKSKLKGDLKGAQSIRLLEEFLNQHIGKFDPMIIKNLRDINTLRNNKFPVHKEGEEAIRIIHELGAKYPPESWDSVWEGVIRLYRDSITGLIALF